MSRASQGTTNELEELLEFEGMHYKVRAVSINGPYAIEVYETIPSRPDTNKIEPKRTYKIVTKEQLRAGKNEYSTLAVVVDAAINKHNKSEHEGSGNAPRLRVA